MYKRIIFLCVVSLLVGCKGNAQKQEKLMKKSQEKSFPYQKTEAEWQKQLSSQEYHILRQKGTEYPHTGKYNMHFADGVYRCKGCGQELFTSDSKFETECGWPGFDQSIDGSVVYQKDTSHGMQRVEILCSNCGGHLGHVFEDGPTETHLRYCVNSASIQFEGEKDIPHE